MADGIVNRVSNSSLINLDLEDYYPKGERCSIDIKQWLYEGLILREKEFRSALDEIDWSLYENKFVALTCSSDAIIPSWAYLLITIKLAPFANKIIVGDLGDLENSIFEEVVNSIPVDAFKNQPVIVKGCSTKKIPETAYTLLIKKLQPIAKSIMYGEACSSVPLYKKK